ncbi:MAG: TolC family outer membrane protein [Roseiarcus sp.]|uniref:TolC family outer membrane protein n=1 Tax=Roseiarcus sp. TaxID=1969460 RepID=UPI003BB00B3B
MNSGIGGPEGRATTFGGAAKSALRRLLFATVAIAALGAGASRAETANGALVKAYLNNPDINTQRAAVRVADENVPKANAGYLPTVTGQANVGLERADTSLIGANGTGVGNTTVDLRPRGYGVTANETIFNGMRTTNSISQAESQVLGAREQLRNTEQNTLLAGITAYMDVLRDTAILDLDRNNVQVLQEQLRETRDRFTVGEVTRTDVAQAEASLATAQATELSAVATLQASVARYRQTIGDEPKSLSPVQPIVRPLPRTLPEAISISQIEHPAIVASLHGVDAALLQVKIAEGALYPTVGVTGSVTQQFDANGFPGLHVLAGSLMGQVTIPIYQGGAEYATTRQAKESLGQQELQTDSQRDQVRAAVVAAWGLNQASVGVVRAAKAAVSANEVALTGVREEAKVGQRTTLDVLNAQQALLTARSQLVSAEHDQVVNSYSLLSAVGRLNIPTLGLAVAEYDPRVHFEQVKGKWIGLRTPDGK